MVSSVRLDAAALGTFVDNLARLELEAFNELLGSVAFGYRSLRQRKTLFITPDASDTHMTNKQQSLGNRKKQPGAQRRSK